jgi:predicted porin
VIAKLKNPSKYKFILAAAIYAGCSMTYAQSSVSLYGIVDVEVLHRIGATDGSQTLMTEGAMQGSRWGIKGSEDLGGGWKSLFQLENGFAVFNGKLDQQGQLFGRQAWIGLSKASGSFSNTLTFGRQYTIPFAMMSNFDPLNWANALALSWPFLLGGCRFDNTIQYSLQASTLNALLQYSVGGQPGSVAEGATLAAGSSYSAGPLMLGFSLEQSKDAKQNIMKYGSLGAKLSLGNSTIFALYELSLRDANFTPGASGTSAPLANTNLLSNAGNPNTRRDQVIDVGASYYVTPFLQTTVGVMHDSASGVTGGGRGNDTTTYAVVDYFLSKRTDMYAEVDYTRLTGAEVGDPYAPSGALGPHHSSVTEMGVGLRTRF